MEKQMTASISEFARIVGVNHAAVIRAVRDGVRLSESVIHEQDGKTRITIATGCYEWIANRNESKGGARSRSATPGIMSRDKSAQMDRHYAALMKRIEYRKSCEELIPLANFERQVCESIQTCRDTFLQVPLLASELTRPYFLRLIRDQGDSIIQEKQKEIDDAVIQIRLAIRKEVCKALDHASDMIDEQYKREKENAETRRQAHEKEAGIH